MEIAEFLLARIAEDRVMATLREWHTRDCDTHPNEAGYSYPCDCGVPERMAAECEAKRRIAEEYREAVHYYDARPSVPAGEVTGLERALMLLALPYAGHPDYRAEWKP